jgi:hypothetical protein
MRIGLRLVDGEVITLGPTTIVLMRWQPTWFGRLLGRSVEYRTATSSWPGGRVYEWDDTGRVLLDRELAIVAAIDREKLQRQLDQIAADDVRRLAPHLRLIN